jgi:hypothetical protein
MMGKYLSLSDLALFKKVPKDGYLRKRLPSLFVCSNYVTDTKITGVRQWLNGGGHFIKYYFEKTKFNETPHKYSKY